MQKALSSVCVIFYIIEQAHFYSNTVDVNKTVANMGKRIELIQQQQVYSVLPFCTGVTDCIPANSHALGGSLTPAG